ncbi:Guanylate kinase [Pseudonocardia sp. Ae168_Ps1]|nr:Guanylate kinase [Pseudonocardia sp. Ae150A_Ps1]OLL78511.1 Guanylate kinase [Pseudonocardia sp. Ae168_Ps1]OLL87364.1 Guanylate kinase [Pseudonocardia sp. Ae263_Ps1]OLL92607.1 Guanylate kinase [Pseudonocardia sp. Ae356_Ps1]
MTGPSSDVPTAPPGEDDRPARGRLLVLAGPSGVGKSSVVAGLREALPELLFSVSATTRPARPGEVDGRDYHFVTRETFDALIERGDLLEWAEVHGGLQRSGTPRVPVEQALGGGRPVLVEVDLQGARSVKRVLPECVTVFVAPPSMEELARRLTDRGTDTTEQRERRLRTAIEEMDAQDEFDEVVVNDDLQAVIRRLVALAVDRDAA